MSKRILSLALSLLLVTVLSPALPVQAAGNATQEIVVEGFDWGPAVSKIILTFEEAVDANSFTEASFTVQTIVQGAEAPAERVVADAYLCDASGAKITDASGQQIALVMDVVKSDAAGNPFFYNEWYNEWADPYTNEIIASGLTSEGVEISAVIDPKPTGKIMPGVDPYDVDQSFQASDNTTLNYASYSPAEDGGKHPLVIWLHGMGEGSTGGGSDIAILGANLTNLASESFQTVMGGAYVLVPQALTYWMDDGAAPMSMTQGGTPSIYETSLWELILDFVKNHPNIDTDRIIIGGCSNGGYMTMNMLFLHPDYFAAAYPICAPFESQYATDAMIESIKEIPIRFTNALGDEVVDPRYSIDIFNRLIDAGSTTAQISLFGPIEDSAGNIGFPAYIQHFSWVFALNDSYDKALAIPANTDFEAPAPVFTTDGSEPAGFTFQLKEPNNQTSLWNWLAEQSK